MTVHKKSQITTEETNACPTELSAEQTRRRFLKKYGKLAVVTPVALTILMTPKTSYAINSDAKDKICEKKPNHKHCRTPSGF